MNKVVELMLKKINWLAWLVFSNFVELWFSKRNSTSRCNSCRNFVDIIYNYSEGSIKRLAK